MFALFVIGALALSAFTAITPEEWERIGTGLDSRSDRRAVIGRLPGYFQIGNNHLTGE